MNISNKLRHVFYKNTTFLLLRPIITRSVGIQTCDLEEDNIEIVRKRKEKLKLLNSEEMNQFINELKLPFKMQNHQELAREFMHHRLASEFKEELGELCYDSYECVLDEVADPEERERLREDMKSVIQYYNLVMRQSLYCPKEISLAEMKIMLFKYKSFGARLKYLNFLFVKEFDIWKENKKKMKRKEEEAIKEMEEMFEEIGCFDEHGQLQYGFWRNTLFSRYWEKTIQQYSLHKLRQAALFGQRLVVDCSYDEDMAEYETISVCRQMSSIYRYNRFVRNCEPFHVMFTGYTPNHRGLAYARKMLSGVIDNPGYLFNIHKESYRELLPEDTKLIYLSPDARHLMEKFDHNAVYIIGALVSKTQKSKKSYEKAMAEGIETVRLPIHQHIRLRPQVKRVLSFQGCFKILLEMKEHGDWKRAFQAGIQSHKLIEEDRPPEIR